MQSPAPRTNTGWGPLGQTGPGFLVDSELDMIQQRVLTAKAANSILRFIDRSMAIRSREVINKHPSFLCTCETPYRKPHPVLSPLVQENVDHVEQAQSRATKQVWELERLY